MRLTARRSPCRRKQARGPRFSPARKSPDRLPLVTRNLEREPPHALPLAIPRRSPARADCPREISRRRDQRQFALTHRLSRKPQRLTNIVGFQIRIRPKNFLVL